MNRIRSGVICFALTQMLLLGAGFGSYSADSARAEDGLQVKYRLPDSDEGLSGQPEPGFTSLFNGRDLSGWGYRPTLAQMLKARDRWKSQDPNAAAWPVVTEPEWFDDRVSTEDGRYQSINRRLAVTIPPEGRKIQQLWTSDEFPGDFVLKSEDRSASIATNATAVLFTRRRPEAVQNSCEF